MVRNSLKKFIGKYPYFLNRNKDSNFYRSSDVNNRGIQRMYNELVKVYESFHLNKRLLVWREQDKNYDYDINFEVNYPLLKKVYIYKDDTLIYYDEFTEEEKKSHFTYTYKCRYTRQYIRQINPYLCTECSEIVFNDETPLNCPKCGNHNYHLLETYECTECGEIYFQHPTDTNRDCTKNNHPNSLEPINIYQCLNCESIYFNNTKPSNCEYCYIEDYTNQRKYELTLTDEYGDNINDLLTNNEKFTITLSNSFYETTLLLNKENNYTTSTDYLPYHNSPYTIKKIIYNDPYEDIDITETSRLPNHISLTFQLKEMEKTYTPQEVDLMPPEYIDDETIHEIDNRNIPRPNTDIETLDKRYKIISNNIYTNNVTINIYNEKTEELVDTVTLSDENDYEEYSKILPTKITDTNETINYKLEYRSDYDLTILEEPVYDGEDLEINVNENNNNHIELPIIPNNKFRIEIETYEEVFLVKGYPENDEYLINSNGEREHSIYDHDQSLDEIGALNNIPRKKYNIIHDHISYPYTEPPYNNRATEDDYHYMKRMLEYNQRLWTMNPVSLELWKIYGLESELINRERYLLKVFDERKHPFDEKTGLVKCWSPLPWEHKDRFCDGDVLEKTYFFVTCDNVRPLMFEDVTFHFQLLNSHANVMSDDYYVDIYKVHDDYSWITDDYSDFVKANKDTVIHNGYWELLNKSKNDTGTINSYSYNKLYGKSVIVPYDLLNENTTKLVFIAYQEITGNIMGTNNLSIIRRDSDNADWFVDATANTGEGYIGDGSRSKPFLTLQEACDNVTTNNDLICLLSSVNLDKPVVVKQPTKIVGYENSIPTIERVDYIDSSDASNNQLKDSKFFKIIGNKNCSLTLSNLVLKNGLLASKVNINTWQNNNRDLDNVETVVIHGGAVKIDLIILDDLNTDNLFYPFDFIHFKVKLTKSDETPLPNQQVVLKYGNTIVESYVTDINGECTGVFNLKEYEIGEYNFNIGNVSDVFFESIISYIINAHKHYHDTLHPLMNDGITCNFSDLPTNTNVNIFRSDINDVVGTVNTGLSGTISKTFLDNPFGRYVYYTTIDNTVNGRVHQEYIVETRVPMSRLKNNLNNSSLIKNVTVNENNGGFKIEYDTIVVNDDTILSELNGVCTDIRLEGDKLIIERFRCGVVNETDNYILYHDYVNLVNALKSISFDMVTGDLSFVRVGEFK